MKARGRWGGRGHPAPKLVRLLTRTDGLWNLGAG